MGTFDSDAVRPYVGTAIVMPLPPAPKKPDDRVEARYFGPAASVA